MATLVRLDKIGNHAHIISGVSASDLNNGAIVKRGALRADKESYDVAAVADIAADDVYFHASVRLMADETKNPEDFVLKTGKAGRFYRLGVGDIVTITDDGITGTTSVGGVVLLAAGTKLAYAATVGASTSKLVFEVIDKETLNGYAASVLQVIKSL